MQTYLDCYPCILRQAIEASRMVGATEAQQTIIVNETLNILRAIPAGRTPPAIGSQVHQLVRKVTGKDDPYEGVKRASTAKALAMVSELRSLIGSSVDKLETAIRISIAGNIMDFGVNKDYDLWEVVNRVLIQDFAINDLPLLREQLALVDSVLLIADNAGETVFDRLLIEALPVPVTYVVRGGPVINDATYQDAFDAGIEQVAEVIDNGTRIAGTILSECSPAFRARFDAAGLILAKGMGNYETLSTTPGPIFFLLQVKCSVISSDIGAPEGSIIIKRTSATPEILGDPA
jgi:uncharacterized protein with ATP-grasp and redox domains